MITTPEIICDLFSFLDKDQIERIQLVNQFWNNAIIRQKNILPLRDFFTLEFDRDRIHLYVTVEDRRRSLVSYIINFDGTNLSKGNVSSRYSQLTVDEVLTNLNDVVFHFIEIEIYNCMDDFLKWIKPVTKKTGGRFRFRGRFGKFYKRHIWLDEIFGKGFLNTARYKIYSS